MLEVRLIKVCGIALIGVLAEIFLVGHKSYFDVVIGELTDLVKPVFQIEEGLKVGDIIDKESTNSKSVVGCGDAEELLGT